MLTFLLVVGTGIAVAFAAAPLYLCVLTVLRPWLDKFRPVQAQGQVFILEPGRKYEFGAATVVLITLAVSQTAGVKLLDVQPKTVQRQVFFQIG